MEKHFCHYLAFAVIRLFANLIETQPHFSLSTIFLKQMYLFLSEAAFFGHDAAPQLNLIEVIFDPQHQQQQLRPKQTQLKPNCKVRFSQQPILFCFSLKSASLDSSHGVFEADPKFKQSPEG